MYRNSTKAPYVITAFNHHVLALDARTGKEVWRVALNGSPIRIDVTEDRVVALGWKLLVIEYATGRVVHTIDQNGTTLLVVEDLAYVSTNGTLSCVSLVEGKQLWRNELPGTGLGTAAVGVPGLVAQADVS